MRRVALLVLLAALGAPCQTLPDAPSSSRQSELFQPRPAQQAMLSRTSLETNRRTVDGQFLLLSGVVVATTIADVELTSHCLSAATQRCSEANPLFGSNPSRGKLYAINLPILAGEITLSHWLKKRDPERKRWMIPMLLLTGTHAIGAASAVRYY